MSRIVLSSNASGTGDFTIQSPATNTNRVLTLPDEAGTVLTSASTTVLPKGGPAFRVRMANAGAYQATNNTWTVVPLDDTVFSEGTNAINLTGSTQTVNGISLPAYAFAPTVAGWYQINFTAGVYSLTVGTGRIVITIADESGTAVSSIHYTGISATSQSGSSSFIKYMNGTTNSLRLQLNQNNGASRPFDYSDYNTVDVCLIRSA